jgi:carbon monoxide dehydrogenase subunit G
MEIEQSFRVPFTADQVWRCFHDTEGIVSCLPGASLTAPPDDGKLKLAMTVKLGPIVAAFAGDGEIRFDDATRRGSVSGGGSDRKSGSRVKGEAAFSLHEEPETQPQTRVDIRVDYSIAGSLAQFSRGGIVRELAARLTEAFAQNLKHKLETENVQTELTASMTEATTAAPSDTEGAAPVPRPTPAPAPAEPLNLGGLFWPMLVGRIRRWLRLDPRG